MHGKHGLHKKRDDCKRMKLFNGEANAWLWNHLQLFNQRMKSVYINAILQFDKFIYSLNIDYIVWFVF